MTFVSSEDEIRKLRARIEELTVENTKLTAENTKLTRRNAELETKNVELDTDVRDFEHENGVLKTSHEEMEEKMETYQRDTMFCLDFVNSLFEDKIATLLELFQYLDSLRKLNITEYNHVLNSDGNSVKLVYPPMFTKYLDRTELQTIIGSLTEGKILPYLLPHIDKMLEMHSQFSRALLNRIQIEPEIENERIHLHFLFTTMVVGKERYTVFDTSFFDNGVRKYKDGIILRLVPEKDMLMYLAQHPFELMWVGIDPVLDSKHDMLILSKQLQFTAEPVMQILLHRSEFPQKCKDYFHEYLHFFDPIAAEVALDFQCQVKLKNFSEFTNVSAALMSKTTTLVQVKKRKVDRFFHRMFNQSLNNPLVISHSFQMNIKALDPLRDVLDQGVKELAKWKRGNSCDGVISHINIMFSAICLFIFATNTVFFQCVGYVNSDTEFAIGPNAVKFLNNLKDRGLICFKDLNFGKINQELLLDRITSTVKFDANVPDDDKLNTVTQKIADKMGLPYRFVAEVFGSDLFHRLRMFLHFLYTTKLNREQKDDLKHGLLKDVLDDTGAHVQIDMQKSCGEKNCLLVITNFLNGYNTEIRERLWIFTFDHPELTNAMNEDQDGYVFRSRLDYVKFLDELNTVLRDDNKKKKVIDSGLKLEMADFVEVDGKYTFKPGVFPYFESGKARDRLTISNMHVFVKTIRKVNSGGRVGDPVDQSAVLADGAKRAIRRKDFPGFDMS